MSEKIEEKNKELFEPLLLEEIEKGEFNEEEKKEILLDYEGELDRLKETFDNFDIQLVKEYPIGSVLVKTDLEELLDFIESSSVQIKKISSAEGKIRLD